jgi:mono/diheme cytochrome c family protein
MTPLGKAVYESKCALCHGQDGKGNGPAASTLNPRPRDFTSGKYKIRTTSFGSIPTDEDISRSILQGLHGTPMPDWAPFLRGDTLNAVVAYVKSFSPRFLTEKPVPLPLTSSIPATPAGLAAGKATYEKLQCGSCHGADGAGTGAVTSNLVDDWGRPVPAANLTEPWTFRGGAGAADIYARLKTGMSGAAMPSFADAASDRDLLNVANYVVTLGRKPVWQMTADEVQAFYASQDAAAKNNPVVRGKYLVETYGCEHCHSPVTEDGHMMEEFRLAGGQTVDLYPFGVYVTHNLTSDKETGIGNYSDDQIKQAFTHGIALDGWRMLPFPMPWTSYASLTDDDQNAIVAYLRSLPPIYNKTPAPDRLNFFSYLWGKFRFLILRQDNPGHVFPGNAGTPRPYASLVQP